MITQASVYNYLSFFTQPSSPFTMTTTNSSAADKAVADLLRLEPHLNNQLEDLNNNGIRVSEDKVYDPKAQSIAPQISVQWERHANPLQSPSPSSSLAAGFKIPKLDASQTRQPSLSITIPVEPPAPIKYADTARLCLLYTSPSPRDS